MCGRVPGVARASAGGIVVADGAGCGIAVVGAVPVGVVGAAAGVCGGVDPDGAAGAGAELGAVAPRPPAAAPPSAPNGDCPAVGGGCAGAGCAGAGAVAGAGCELCGCACCTAGGDLRSLSGGVRWQATASEASATRNSERVFIGPVRAQGAPHDSRFAATGREGTPDTTYARRERREGRGPRAVSSVRRAARCAAGDRENEETRVGRRLQRLSLPRSRDRRGRPQAGLA